MSGWLTPEWLAEFGPEAREANEAQKCKEPGCTANRWGFTNRCEPHSDIRVERRRAAAKKAVETRRKNHPHRFRPKHAEVGFWRERAGAIVQVAKKAGILPDLSTGLYACSDCGGVASEYDHRDYALPLDVQPVCRKCNNRRGVAKYPSAADFDFKKLPSAASDKAAA